MKPTLTYMMLGCTAILWLVGCASNARIATTNLAPGPSTAGSNGQGDSTSAQKTSDDTGAATPTSDTDSQSASADTGGASMPTTTPANSRPHLPHVDPGAQMIVNRMLNADTQRPRDADGWTRIELAGLTNYSHATHDEFRAFRRRLADLLSRAARDDKVIFTAEAAEDQAVHRRLTGTAYLITAGGFDQWELYLTLMPADEAWTIWRSDRPVRVLRDRPAYGQQVFIPSTTQP